MSCCGGANQFLVPTVPAGNGDGPALDVSGLIADKAFYCAGDYNGTYTILGSLDNSSYVPIVSFTGGLGPRSVRVDKKITLRSIKVRRQADQAAIITLAGQSTVAC
jgi:hypothetical protein